MITDRRKYKMKLNIRIFSALLAVMMLVGAFTGMSVIGVSAADDTEKEIPRDEQILNTYAVEVYKTPEEKIAKMTLILENKYGYNLYADGVSGEVAVKELATGNIIFSNPYDVGASAAADTTKQRLLSQISVQFIDNSTNGVKTLYSFTDAAMREQISMVRIKNGVRLEYTIGREETRKLVPRWITVENYNKYLIDPMQTAVDNGEMPARTLNQFKSHYSTQDPNDPTLTQKAYDNMIKNYPFCETGRAIMTFDPALEKNQAFINKTESWIKAYAPDYSFDQMEADHAQTGYVAKDEQFPVFKLALEYTLTKDGIRVRMPSNGLRYDMVSYTLENLVILPYMGAGNNKNSSYTDEFEDYNFFPDGSGSLFDFAQLNIGAETLVKGKVYGADYAYHQISGTYEKVIRTPVYGTVSTEKITTYYYLSNSGAEQSVKISNTVMTSAEARKYIQSLGGTYLREETEAYQQGFVAFLEEGESLAELETYHGGVTHEYNSIRTYFNPKPKDSYSLGASTAIQDQTADLLTVVSERKYTGSFTILYKFLTDPTKGEEIKKENSSFTYYDTTWLGMAEAYRDHLIKKGTLSKLTEEDLQEDIPLYIESFGAMETEETIMTIPVTVMTPLTTFEDVLQMYTDLSSAGVNNINFKLTDFANGGLWSTVPASLKWEKAVGGSDGFKDLIAKAEEINAADDSKHLGLFPDFNFAYINNNTWTDSTNLKDDAAKTIDNRYTSYRSYDASYQSYVSFWQLVISPSRYSKFYTKLLKNYAKYDISGMSVGSLGNALNSDFDEDDPYNREDSKKYTVLAFEDLQSAGYSLMTEGGNAYTWGYVDHILNVNLDSSRYIKASASVPFIGAVLHGYIQFTGTAMNKEGNIDYAILRAIENGAGMYFLLSFQNTDELKEDGYYSQNYSLRYDIWKEDVISYYQELNAVLHDVQDKLIIKHEFLESERVLDQDELDAAIAKELEEAIAAEIARQEYENAQKLLAVANVWSNAENLYTDVKQKLDRIVSLNSGLEYDKLFGDGGTLPLIQSLYISTLLSGKSMEQILADETLTDEAIRTLDTIKLTASQKLKDYNQLLDIYKEIENMIKEVEEGILTIQNSTLADDVKSNMIAQINVFLNEVRAPADADPGAPNNTLFAQATQQRDKNKTWVEKLVTDLTANEILVQFNAETAFAGHYITAETLAAAAVIIETDDGTDDNDNTAIEVNNNNVVAVTYGTRDDATHEKTAYKTFILNYNFYAVVVNYGGSTYTIPAGGYVVVQG